MSLDGAPPGEPSQTAVWTGREMILFGRSANTQWPGGRYAPATDTWRVVNPAQPQTRDHTAIWTGDAMIVWGGGNFGGRYLVDISPDDDADGFTTCAGDCDDAQPSVNPQATELCDELDNDCSGAADEHFPTPGRVHGLVFTSPSGVAWSAAADAERYDVVEGDLAMLASSAGDFSAAIEACLVDDGAGLATSVPAESTGRFFLVRGQAACKSGSWSSGEPSELPGRDVEIALAPLACP